MNPISKEAMSNKKRSCGFCHKGGFVKRLSEINVGEIFKLFAPDTKKKVI